TCLLSVLRDCFLPAPRTVQAEKITPPALEEEVAVLVFDSSHEPLPGGFRGSSPAKRHRLYKKGSLFVDVASESQNEPRRIHFSGQVLDVGVSKCIGGASVLLQSGSRTLAETTTSESGEFALEAADSGAFRPELALRLSLDQSTMIVPLGNP